MTPQNNNDSQTNAELSEQDRKAIAERFESNIFYSPDGCWYWLGKLRPDGYGHFRMKGPSQQAHRASYQLFKGSIPDGLFVLHSCDNRACVNPNHLRVGTPYDNNHDMVIRGRSTYGERNATAKFTTIQVQAILDAEQQDTNRPISVGILKGTVQ